MMNLIQRLSQFVKTRKRKKPIASNDESVKTPNNYEKGFSDAQPTESVLAPEFTSEIIDFEELIPESARSVSEYSKRLFIAQAIEAKSDLQIIYYGGSNPGGKRTITPASVGNRLRAFCHNDNIEKTFLYHLIDLSEYKEIDHKSGQSKLIADWSPTPISLESSIREYLPELESYCDQLQLTENTIEMYCRYKNGKLQKTPFLSLEQDNPSDPGEDAKLFYLPEEDMYALPYNIRGRGGKRLSTHLTPRAALDHFLRLAKESQS